MIIREFNIEIKPRKDSRSFQMKVEVYYESEQVIRYRVSGGDRSFEMEKLLNRTTGDWKIISGIELRTEDYEAAAMALRDIQRAIEAAEREQSGNVKTSMPQNPKYREDK